MTKPIIQIQSEQTNNLDDVCTFVDVLDGDKEYKYTKKWHWRICFTEQRNFSFLDVRVSSPRLFYSLIPEGNKIYLCYIYLIGKFLILKYNSVYRSFIIKK